MLKVSQKKVETLPENRLNLDISSGKILVTSQNFANTTLLKSRRGKFFVGENFRHQAKVS